MAGKTRNLLPDYLVGWKPFGVGEQRPNNYLEIWKAAVENRGDAPRALRIMREGVCDGCALGTSGLKDWTIPGIHLCNIRLRLLRMNTMPAFDPAVAADAAKLDAMRGDHLRELGRIPEPMMRRRGEPGFTPVSWDGDAETAFRVEIQVDGWDRHRLLEDMTRTFAEAGINILDAHCTVNHPMVKNRFVVEVGDTRTLDQAINRLRNIDAVFDAYRVTPGAG